MPALLRKAEGFIEGRDAIDLDERDAEGFGDVLEGFGGEPAEAVLDILKDLDEGPRTAPGLRGQSFEIALCRRHAAIIIPVRRKAKDPLRERADSGGSRSR